jgi:hypothetical protein
VAASLIVVALVFALVLYASKALSSTAAAATANDMSPTETDGKSGTKMPSNMSGTNTGLQFWMYIKDWDYRFGQKKMVIDVSDATNPNVVAPGISLHPTDNTLDFEVSLHSTGSNTDTTDIGHGESQIVSVENVPLQAWFSVSVTIFQRNIDIYINGRLVKSAVLAGIPKPANGSLTVGGGGGFSGAVCTIHTSSTQLVPSDAAAFYAAGTACSTSTAGSTTSEMSKLSLFGYTFIFGVKDSAGKDVAGLSSSDVTGYFGSSK